MKGGLFENFVINEYIKFRWNQGLRHHGYFWQDRNRKEIDLIIDSASELTAVEIKSGRTRNSSFLDNLRGWQRFSSLPPERLHVVYGGDADFHTSDGDLVSWRNCERVFEGVG